jgi:hypothetical protein
MGCNCAKDKARAKEEKRQQDLIAGNVKTVSLEVLKDRRQACRDCEYATKNPHPKFVQFGGITNLSKCKAADKLLMSALKDPTFICPKKKF